jgi:mRNA interferase YafQ
MRRLKEAMLLLIAIDGPMPPEWLDHPLKGAWADRVNFVRAGTHADLFE